MATRQSIENMMTEANQCLETAREQLDRANKLGYEVNEEYTEAQLALEELEQQIDKLMDSANHQQKDQLHRLHLQVSQYLNDMILDHQQLK
ncbi:DUF2524 family protein [Pontibacillus salicampi]|uniref:DUF2524 family protein n=1 Tax=Pontibacillus salicampi TaxID=1449801 RepID=A0ABV6LNK7_9BACI